MKFNVSQKHINHGIPYDPCNCALALCVKENFDIPKNNTQGNGDGDYVTVDGEFVDIYLNGQKVRTYSCTKKMNRFIKNFDKSKSNTKPSTFQVKQLISYEL